MLRESACCFSSTIEAGNDGAPQSDYLRFAVNAQAGNTIVNARRGPRRIKRGRLNFKFGSWLSEVCILAFVHKGIVSSYRLLQGSGRHGFFLILAENSSG